MIRTKEYIIVKKRGNKWVPTKVYGSTDIYSLRNIKKALRNMRNGNTPGHSKNSQYKIMEVCYDDWITLKEE